MGKSTFGTNQRVNEQIRISPVRVINENNEMLGVMDTREAQRLAREAGMDLVEVSPNERPPVCRIMDYGKFKYNLKKKSKKQHEQQLKELRMRPKTDEHDKNIRINQAMRFLSKGDKVQFKMMFRGRERAHQSIGFETFRSIIAHFGELVKVERHPTMDGRDLLMVLSPNKQAFEKLAAEARAAGKVLAHEQPQDEPEELDDDEGDEDEGGNKE